mmetsp:Transcript_20832/g.67525  ORF Transcript_20832/g.67525 Transcript_20832/m.67525 type:complete len:216 (-) Transcript_20832:1087-1734(-)
MEVARCIAVLRRATWRRTSTWIASLFCLVTPRRGRITRTAHFRASRFGCTVLPASICRSCPTAPRSSCRQSLSTRPQVWRFRAASMARFPSHWCMARAASHQSASRLPRTTSRGSPSTSWSLSWLRSRWETSAWAPDQTASLARSGRALRMLCWPRSFLLPFVSTPASARPRSGCFSPLPPARESAIAGAATPPRSHSHRSPRKCWREGWRRWQR